MKKYVDNVNDLWYFSIRNQIQKSKTQEEKYETGSLQREYALDFN